MTLTRADDILAVVIKDMLLNSRSATNTTSDSLKQPSLCGIRSSPLEDHMDSTACRIGRGTTVRRGRGRSCPGEGS